MKEILINDLNESISNLSNYIEYIDSVKSDNDIIEKYLKKKKSSNNIRIFEYKSLIISMYGILENTISNWIVEYVSELNTVIPSYTLLPDRIIQQNKKNTIKILNKIIDNRGSKFDYLDEDDLINNLSISIRTPDLYIINNKTFSPDSGNLKFRIIEESFENININISRELSKILIVEQYIEKVFGKHSEKQLRNHFSVYVDDLVTRRNDIAHGNPIDELLDTSIIIEYLKVLHILLEGIYLVLLSKFQSHNVKYNYIKAEDVIDVFRKGSIVGVKASAVNIKINDTVIVEKSSGIFIEKKILGIQKDRASYSEIVIEESQIITLNLGNGMSKKDNIYFKKNI